jgi:hypothetical protein
MQIKIVNHMKQILFILLILGSLTTFAQEKKQETDSLTKKKAVATPGVPKSSKDSLGTSQSIDSLKAELTLYKSFYAYISKKFFPEKYKNLPINRAIPLADSLSAARDKRFKGLESMSKEKKDSLSYALITAEALEEENETLRTENQTFRIENQTFKMLLASLIGEKVYPQNEAEIKGNWQVFVNPLKVTGSGQVSAIVSLEKMVLIDSIAKQTIKQIVFLEEDLADVYFLGGKKTKCFYKVIGFSRDKTYSITLKKSDEIDITIFITAVPRGLQLSYKLGKNPNYYMFGYMRR